MNSIKAENFIEEIIIEDLKSGKAKEVITRCPPEPSGYWHIGHCKAWIINFEIAAKFGGHTYLRMDDTNPSKEDGDFADSYLLDLKWLGYQPKDVIFASEAYFDEMFNIAKQLIKDGLAYVCELSAEEVSNTRGTLTVPGTESPYRNRPIEESLKMFDDMKLGKYKTGEITLRAKIDMAHPNVIMRDPVIYRVLHMEHYKTKDKWCIYPMYDYAHPLEDALEGTTFSLCDITFENNRPLYNWFIEKCWKKPYPPRQIEFGKLNIENVLLGKRFLKQLVNDNKASGWDDPRFFTIVGMRRRGITANAIKNFIKASGVTKSNSIMPLSAFEYYIREDLQKVATKAMVVTNPLKVIITNYEGVNEPITIKDNGDDMPESHHTSFFGKEIYIEKEDFEISPPPKYKRLTLGGYVRLKDAYIIKCNNVIYKTDGEIDYLECEYFPSSKSGNDQSGIKVKGVIQFVEHSNKLEVTIRDYKNLIKPEYLEPSKSLANGVGIDEMLLENSLIESVAFAEKFLQNSKVEDKFQFIRKGYYTVDKDSTKDNVIFNHTISLKDSYNK